MSLRVGGHPFDGLLEMAAGLLDGVQVQRRQLAAAVEERAKHEARARRIDTLAYIVAAIMLSRACPDDPPLADEILEACRTRILGAP